MCGIAGIFNRNGAQIDKQLLIRMTRTLTHRGPDEEGFFVNTRQKTSNRESQIDNTQATVTEPHMAVCRIL